MYNRIKFGWNNNGELLKKFKKSNFGKYWYSPNFGLDGDDKSQFETLPAESIFHDFPRKFGHLTITDNNSKWKETSWWMFPLMTNYFKGKI